MNLNCWRGVAAVIAALCALVLFLKSALEGHHGVSVIMSPQGFAS